MSLVFPSPVPCEVVHDLIEPGPGILRGVEFSEGEDESILNDIARIFHGEALFADGPPDQGQEKLTVKGLELRGIRLPRGRLRPRAALPRRLPHERPSLGLKMKSLPHIVTSGNP